MNTKKKKTIIILIVCGILTTLMLIFVPIFSQKDPTKKMELPDGFEVVYTFQTTKYL